MNLAPAPLQYIRDIWQGILEELKREDRRNIKRDVAETFNGGLTVSGDLDVEGNASVTGTLAVTGEITATAGQIAFPATQNASADAHTLDDYEEGTFAPVVGDGTNNYTLSGASGSYTKVGNRVSGEIDCPWTSIGSAGAGGLRIGGLPFSVGAYSAIGIAFLEGVDNAGGKQVVGYTETADATIRLFQGNDNAGMDAVAANSSSASGRIICSFNYKVA